MMIIIPNSIKTSLSFTGGSIDNSLFIRNKPSISGVYLLSIDRIESDSTEYIKRRISNDSFGNKSGVTYL